MSYAVKETYYTLQGEGANAGRAAVFLRFAGCNLWSGLEQDRASAVCNFCDTDFRGVDGPGGGHFGGAGDLARHVASFWPASDGGDRPFVVCTGGEPLLQVDAAMLDAFHVAGFTVAVETNGTQAAPAGLDWVCVSPKASAPLRLCHGDELKLAYPQPGVEPEPFTRLDFQHFFLQPIDGPARVENTRRAVEYCLAHPQWRLSLQTHKVLGIP